MSIKSTLEEVVEEFLRLGIPRFKRREVSPSPIRGKAVAIIGLRRVGKTYLLYQVMSELMRRGKRPEELLYINLEDNRLESLTSKDLSYLVEIYARRAKG